MPSQNHRPPRLRHRRRRRWPVLLLAGSAVVVAVYAFRGGPLPATVAEDPEPLSGVRVGTLAVTLDADAVLVRREQVVRTPRAGFVRHLAEEGARVRVGGEVVEFTPGGAAAVTVQEQPRQNTPVPAGSGESGSGAPTRDATGPLPLLPSAARQEFERLAADIHATAVALNEAQARGEPTAAYQERLDELARAQNALLPALREEAASGGGAAASLPSLPARSASTAGGAGGAATGPGGGTEWAEEPMWTGEAQVVTTSVSGVVLYQTDGLEEVLTPEAVARWGPRDLLNLPYADVTELAEGPVARGGALFKLVDDLEMEMLLLVPADRLTAGMRSDLLERGASLEVAGRDLPLQATVLRIAEEGEHVLLHLSAPLPSGDALRLRRMRVTLRLAEYEGTILPRAAVDVQEGRTGVWVARRGGYAFVPVRVLGGTADEVAVESNLPRDAQVLVAPPPPAARRLTE
ncbi:MAG: HlyD family efflux transporter periplasmic adaptor subunit [Symbiobacterium sp.]|uniref:HlyD family efflux transporter periplasmic adaptor subunit n=1 Tax=Symbiobacterium sp. TaxID=1971213 RepID=UPI0034646924